MYHLTNLKELITKHDLHITGIIQVGASMGEEIEQFKDAGIENVIYIDANPLSFPELHRKAGANAHTAAIWSSDNKILKFKIMDFLACSTLQNTPFKDINEVKTIDVKTVTLNTFLAQHNYDINNYNMLYLDCEGSEIEVLKGVDLSKFNYVYSEFQTELPNTPENLQKALEGFTEIERVTNAHTEGTAGYWGDILFKRI